MTTEKKSVWTTASDQNIVNKEELDDSDIQCGYGKCTPEPLQKCHNSKALLICCCAFAFFQGFSVNGITNVNITTLERRFDLPSSKTAWLSSSYDLCAATLSIFVGYFGAMWHKGRMLTIGALVMAVGALVAFLPHVTAGKYMFGETVESSLCIKGNKTDSCTEGEDTSNSEYLFVFILAQILHGFGGSILYTLALPYIDENIRTKNTPIYIGIFLTFTVVGPAVGYICGGIFLSFYVDIGRVNIDDVLLTPLDPRWVGAWWIGYLIAFVCLLICAVFLGCFARELRSGRRFKKERVSEAHKGTGSDIITSKNLTKETFKTSMKLLFTNTVFIFLTLGAVVEMSATVAFGVFMPKTLQFLYGQSAAMAGIVGGALVIPAAVVGQIAGGVIPRTCNLKVKGLIMQCAVTDFFAIFLSLIFLLKCDLNSIAGVNVEYLNTTIVKSEIQLDNDCNVGCGCTSESYNPVCGSDSVEYFNPCYAGCSNAFWDGQMRYVDCKCIPETKNISNAPVDGTGGLCRTDCNYFYYWIPLFFLLSVLTFVNGTSTQAATLRCLPDAIATFGFGVQSSVVRFLGTVPGPLIFGYIYDISCTVWADKCGTRGACWLYDNQTLAVNITIGGVVLKAMAFLFNLIAWFCYTPPPQRVIQTEDISSEKGNEYTTSIVGIDSRKSENGHLSQNNTADSSVFGHNETDSGYTKDAFVEGTRM